MKYHLFIALLLCAAIFTAASLRCKEERGYRGSHAIMPVENGLALVQTDRQPLKDIYNIPAGATPFLFMKIPVNRAGGPLLESIPGIGPSLAKRIISYREERGTIDGCLSMMNINGIGPKRLKMLERHISYE